MIDAACRECRFWRHERLGHGQCHRRAPRPANQAVLFAGEAVIAIADLLARKYELDWPQDIDAEVSSTSNSTMFPSTYSDDWCGEFEPGRQMGVDRGPAP